MNKTQIICTVRTICNQAAIFRRYARQYSMMKLFASQSELEAKAFIIAAKILVSHAKIAGVWDK